MMDANPQHFRRAVEDIPDWSNGIEVSDKATENLGPNIDDLEPVIGSHGWLRMTGDQIIIGRGRNRGRTIGELEQMDSSYLNWLTSPAGPLEDEAIERLNQR